MKSLLWMFTPVHLREPGCIPEATLVSDGVFIVIGRTLFEQRDTEVNDTTWLPDIWPPDPARPPKHWRRAVAAWDGYLGTWLFMGPEFGVTLDKMSGAFAQFRVRQVDTEEKLEEVNMTLLRLLGRVDEIEAILRDTQTSEAIQREAIRLYDNVLEDLVTK